MARKEVFEIGGISNLVSKMKTWASGEFASKEAATTDSSGLMSSADKTKLDGVAAGATANVGTITGVTTTAPLSGSGSSGSVALSHAASGVTAASKGDDANQTPSFGATFKVTSGTVNATGHLTEFSDHTVKIPDAAATTTSAGLMSATDKAKLDGIDNNATASAGTITGITTTAPLAGAGSSGSVEISHSTSGVTAGSKGDTVDQEPAFGGTFKATSATVNATGHVTALSDHTVTIPSTEASTSKSGLMSAADKAKLNGIASGATANAGTVTAITAGAGLAGGTISGSGTIKANLASETRMSNAATAAAEQADRVYPVALDSNGNLAVNVPWVEGGGNIPDASDESAGLMSPEDKTKLDGVEDGAQVNQDAFANVVVGSTTISAGQEGATLTLEAGSNVTLTPDASNGSVEIAATDTWQANTATADGYVAAGTGHANKVWKTDYDGVPGWRDDENTTYTSKTASSGGTDYSLVTTGEKFAWNSKTSNTGTVTGVTAGVGLAGGTVSTNGTIKASLKSEDAGQIASESMGSTANRQYAVGVDPSGFLSVNIPWQNTTYSSLAASAGGSDVSLVTTGEKATWNAKTNNTGTVTNVTAGVGLAGGPVTSTGTIKAKLRSETSLSNDSQAASEVAGRVYPVVPDKSGYLAVNVPWTDENTHYASSTVTGASATATATAAATNGNVHLNHVENGAVKSSHNIKGGGTTTVTSDASGTITISSADSNTGTVTSVASGVGLTGGTITGSGTLKAKLRSETALANDSAAATETAGRVYPVAVDKSGYLAVNVPWTDTNTQTITGVKGNSETSYRTGNVNITAANIGLGNVNNTSDANKPISTATQTALDAKVSTSLLGVANGVATLGANGTVPESQLPSYVDDVLEYAATDNFPSTGESGKIYVATGTNKTYRWSGSGYVEISASLALGTTSSTAYRGDYGAAAYAHGVTNKGSAFTSGLYKITTNSEGHVTEATAVQKADITALGIPGSDTNTWTAMTGATSSANGTVGYVNAAPPKDGYNTKYLRADGTWSVPPDSDTHHTAYVRAGASGGTANAATTTGNTYINLVENGSNRSGVKLVPGSNMAITSDASGNVTFAATDTTYSSKAAASGGSEVSLVTTGEKYTWNAKTSNTGTVTSVATGVGLTGGTISTSGTVKAKLRSETALSNDSAAATETAGRVYPVAVDKSGYLAVNVPWANDNTTYSAGSGLSLSGTTFNHASTVTAGTAGTSSATSGTNTIAIPYVTYNATGHVTAAGTHTHTISAATQSAAGLMSAADKTKLDGITVSAGAAQVYVNDTFDGSDGSAYSDKMPCLVVNPTTAQMYLVHDA